MVTLKDVALKAGVSPSTVSRVVSGNGRVGQKCREHVQAVIKQMNYRPNTHARALACNRVEMIGLITPNVSTPFNGSIAIGVEEAAIELDYKTLITNTFRSPEAAINAIESFREQGCENIIIHTHSIDDATLVKLAKEIKGLVVVNRFIAPIAQRCVWIDNVYGGRIAAEYLIAQGHKKLAIITDDKTARDPKDRILGIKQAVEDAGLHIPEERILFGINSIGNIEHGRKLARQLIEEKRDFTAVLAYNDMMAIGAINEFQDMGYKVPEDISVIGFDDLFICEVSRPHLSTIHYPIVEVAKFATQLSLALTNGDEGVIGKANMFMPSLVERSSVKNIKNNK